MAKKHTVENGSANDRTARQDLRRAIVSALRRRQQASVIASLELCRSTLGEEELLAAVDVLLDGHLTMGPQTEAFENEWSAWLPADFSLMVNSGSSANLLMLSALTFPGTPDGLRPGDEVVLPAVCWSTSLFPIVQTGCVPVLVDVDRETLNLCPEKVEEAITDKTRAILAIHLLGNPCDIPALQTVADRHGLYLLEDCCEAHGATIAGRRVGTFGTLASFSFYYSHHMTSIEGGMVCGQDRSTWRDLLVSQRAHGWIRGRSDQPHWTTQAPDIDPRWLFVSTGYNVRPTELNAAIGRIQLTKLDRFVEQRMAIRRRLLDRLRPYEPWLVVQRELSGHSHSAFGLSLIVRPEAPFDRKAFQAFLETRRVETRPIVGGNFARQPVMGHVPHRHSGPLVNADLVHQNGLMIGNHADLTAAQEDHLIACIAEFMESHALRAA